MPVITNQFYTQLPITNIPLGDLLVRNELFHPVPADWHVVITDIKGSTNAVLNGRHQDVNLVATGSIVSVLNIAFKMGITVPFFFGGDGATFIIPGDMIGQVMAALALYRENTLINFDLELRTGAVPVSEIYDHGCQVSIAKFCCSANFSIPVVLGDGLAYAEKVIKGAGHLTAAQKQTGEELDLTGMQCRWDRIPPPADKQEVVTLLVMARDKLRQPAVFSRIMNRIDELYGPPQRRQPISVARLKLKTTFKSLGTEMRARLGKIIWAELIITWFVNLYGLIWFSTRNGKDYLNSLVEMSDTLVIDGRINTVISGTASQRKAMQQTLDEMETAGMIIYGIHLSNASVMSCYVRDVKDDHIHFVDGSEGGYTQAARMLKGKMLM